MIIVTGAYGFIGSHIVKQLNARGRRDLILVDDLTNGMKYKNLLGAEFEEYYDVDEFFSRFLSWSVVDEIFHQGAISSTTETDGKRVMHYNVRFTKDLLTRCINYRIPVTYASSASVYGNRTDSSFDPLNLYAYSKMLVDQWVLDQIDRFERIHGWRYFNVYGGNEGHKGDQASPVTKFTKQALDSGVIKIFQGSDEIYRDFVAVDDVVSVVVDAMGNHLRSGIRDLGTGSVLSFRTVAELVRRKHGGVIEMVPFPEELRPGYQYLTRARPLPDRRFMSMTDWLSRN